MSNVTVVTSGTSGIGKAIVAKIVDEASPEDIVIVNYGHNDTAAAQLKEQLPDKCSVEFIKADLSDYDEMLRFAAVIKDKVDHVDWIVLNTGIGTYKSFDDYSIELWRNIMDTNVNIPAFLVRELKGILADNSNLVFMASHAGQMPYSSSVVYSVSKAAVIHLAK